MDRRTLLQASGVGAIAGAATMAGTPAHARPRGRHSVSSWLMARELIADGPDPEHAEALQLYGQFVGSWQAEVTEFFGERRTYTADWDFGWVLHGRGVQDVFGEVAPATDDGTTIRVYDPATGRWVVSWFAPLSRRFYHFHAEQVGDEIVQSGAEFEPGVPMRWVFYDIEDGHYLWRNDLSPDGGTSG